MIYALVFVLGFAAGFWVLTFMVNRYIERNGL